jgi:hypothetical protein
MNFLDAQKEFAESIKMAGSKVKSYFWRLSGDEPNSLCRFLGMEEKELKSILRLCKIYTGEKDNFSKNNFELLMSQCGLDYTTYRLLSKHERFILIGNVSDELVLPKDMYDTSGALHYYPVEDEHFRNVRTKSQRGSLPKLLDAGNQQEANEGNDAATKQDRKGNKKLEQHNVSPKGLLFEFIHELVSEAGKTGNQSISERSARKLERLMLACVDTAAKELVHAVVEKFASVQERSMGGDQLQSKALFSPTRVSSTATMDETVVVSPATTAIDVDLQATPVVALFGDAGTDDDDESMDTTDEFLAELKDEVVLQSLLHKRIHEKKERVFQLEHRNGRRLLVVLPPDTMSAASFEEEARKTGWINVMLNTEERLNGMLLYLAKSHPKKFMEIGRRRKLSMNTIALNTAQTIALARVGKLNDSRMNYVRSFLRQVGKVNLQMSIKEQARIDYQVGLHRTNKQVVFDDYVHDWSMVDGKETKAPEQVHYWNSQLSNEIEAEVDLYLRHLYMEEANSSNNKKVIIPPLIDYVADGFDKPGVTVLFGGDHGDKHCPISCKINLSPPSTRKQRKQLGYQCPLVQFASVQCSKDAYELMNNTVMPMVKDQLNALKQSSIVTVYHKVNPTKAFRSYTVPSSIRPTTVAFLQETVTSNAVDNNSEETRTTMTYSFGDTQQQQCFGSITIDDPVFEGVPYFELAARVVISAFNELFIGDLAFLAMLIGMNNSSGQHCLICMMKKRQFNCEHTQLTPRTKESLAECLERYMMLVDDTSKRPPPNYNGVNAKGLWDIDPQCIVIPILHCPMGLVDKCIESFKHWVNFEVEDFKDADTESSRSVYKLRKQQHQSAIQAHQQALELLQRNPRHPQAKAMEDQANKARKKASKAETQAKKDYDEQMKRHNAKRSSLNQQFETIYRANGIKREHYHGGKFNGVNCIRIMERTQDIFLGKQDAAGIIQRCRESKVATVTDAFIEHHCNNYRRILGLLDAVWSSVRGIDSGLLPTNEQITKLSDALQEAKTLWLAMGLSTQQPKWHLTFDGHLLNQVRKYNGLADKSDESIEKEHQTLKALRERFRGIPSYRTRETCIRRELRRGRSPEIQQHINKYEAMIKQSDSTKRALDTNERLDNKKKVKQERRDAAMAI